MDIYLVTWLLKSPLLFVAVAATRRVAVTGTRLHQTPSSSTGRPLFILVLLIYLFIRPSVCRVLTVQCMGSGPRSIRSWQFALILALTRCLITNPVHL